MISCAYRLFLDKTRSAVLPEKDTDRRNGRDRGRLVSVCFSNPEGDGAVWVEGLGSFIPLPREFFFDCLLYPVLKFDPFSGRRNLGEFMRHFIRTAKKTLWFHVKCYIATLHVAILLH